MPCALARIVWARGAGTVSVCEDRPHDLDTVLGRERRQGELGGIGLIEPRRLIARAVCGEHEDRRTGDTVNQSREERFRRGVDPMQIFYGEDEGVLLTAVEAYLPQRLEGLPLQRLRADAHQRLSPGLNLQQAQEIGCPVGISHVHRLQPLTDLLSHGLGAISGRDTAVRPQQVEHGQVGHGAAVGPTVPFQVGDRVRCQGLAPFREEP